MLLLLLLPGSMGPTEAVTPSTADFRALSALSTYMPVAPASKALLITLPAI